MDRMFITAPPYPPSLLPHRDHRQQAQPAVRRRRLHNYAKTVVLIMERLEGAAFLIVDKACLE